MISTSQFMLCKTLSLAMYILQGAPPRERIAQHVVSRTHNSRRKYGEKFPRQDGLKKQPPDLFVHARKLLVEANRLDATKAHTTPPSCAACTAINNLG